MVLAELAASGELVEPGELAPGDGIALLPVRLDGIRLNAGLGIGAAVLHAPRIVVHRVVAEDPDQELERLRKAIAEMQSAIDDLLAASDVAAGGEHRDVLETYRMFAADRGWLARMREAVRSGLTAEAAVQKVQDDNRARMSQVSDPYLRERLADLEDLANRLLQHLTGTVATAAAAEHPGDYIVIARAMGPAELLDYDRRGLRGLVLEEGSPTAHVAIVARALDIPVVGRVKDLLARVEPGDLVVADGDNADVFIRPGEDIQQAIEANLRMRVARKETYAAIRSAPASTLDGTTVTLQLNAGLLIDLPHLDESGAEGIGLYRTEIPFMVRNSFPDVAEQTELYRRVLDSAGERPVTFRTLDIGGDKVLPYLPEAEEQNPAMGWRAIRIALDRPAMLRQQLRAMLRAASGRALRVMFPMVAEVAEYLAAREVLMLEARRLKDRGIAPPSEINVGLMIEVPALVWQLEALLPLVDFLSVGSNDLVQFLFACDRDNPRLAGRYDTLSPALLSVLADIIKHCAGRGVPVSLCGEMAGSPLDAMALVGLGFRILSMAPSSIGPVKAMIRSLDLASLKRFLAGLAAGPDHSVRGKLAAYARDHGVAIAG